MNYEGAQLRDLIRATRQRRRLLLALRGVAVCLGIGACVLLLTGWAAHRYRHSEAALIALRLGALTVCAATAYLALVRPLMRRITDARLARLIEERAPGADDRFVTAVEIAAAAPRGVSPAIVQRLVSDADRTAATVDANAIVQRRSLSAYGALALASLLVFVGVLKWGPGSVAQGVAQLVAPASLAAAPNALSIKVKPGTARVPKGSDQEITATLVNFNAEPVTFFTRPLGAKDDAGWQGQPMEAAKAEREFQFSIFNIQSSVEYFVEANNVRSEVFKLDVADLPFVKQLDLALNFPAYTRIAAKTIEDGGDIAALKGTVATITARLSNRASAARLVLADGRKVEMRAIGPDFVGALTVAGDTSYYVELVSVDGETYRGSNEYDITVLTDQPPSISFERPGRDTKATSLEEVFTQARAEDDYGVAAVEMFFSVNGGAERKINLQDLSRDAARSLTGTHTFFLEEFKLKPGDFISYYAKARDAASETTSDIYFIEVKPFEMQYRQIQQDGAGGGGGGSEEQNALTHRQKELIAATHRLLREGTRYTAQERTEGYAAVVAGQEKLRADTTEFIGRIGKRLGEQPAESSQIAQMVRHLIQAASEMGAAVPPLKQQGGGDALPPEQRALQQLLAADAVLREMQVAFGNQQGGGGSGSERESREMTDLFELELDKMKNQYETLQREQRQQARQEKTEAERRLEELARRQERALEEQRRRQQQGQPRNSASGGGGGRQQQELIEEARKAARELERLSRERRDARMQELSRQLEQAADEMQRAQASSANNMNESIAQGERALERLEQTRRRLQQMSSGGNGQQGRKQEIGELRQRAAEAAARQREIGRDVENLARRGGAERQDAAGQSARARLAERKNALADSVNNLEQDIEQQARALGEGQQRAARQLADAAESLRRNRVAERIQSGKRSLENNQADAARAEERAVERGLNELAERLQAAESAAGRNAASNAEEALERTRRLADDLESLRRRLDQRSAGRPDRAGQQQSNQQQGNQQQGSQQQGNQQQGKQQTGGQQQGGQSQAGQQQQGAQAGQPEQGGAGGNGGGDARQLGAEWRERLRDAEELRRAVGGTANNPVGDLGQTIEQLRRLADGRMQGDAQTAAALKAQVIEPLRQLELELSRRLQAQFGRTNLRLGDEGAAPERYRKSVEEYYRRLSQGGRR